ncbi:MAG: BRO family protein, partial [Candidatus Fonsibacter sp.]
MTEIMKFNFNSNAITCIVVGGDPWFKGNEIATILGYTCPRYAIRDHVPEKFKK